MADKKIEGRVTAFCDGGSRGNPGPAGYGVFIQADNGTALAELGEFLGRRTNNFAEYQGLLAALNWALENGVQTLRVVSDSELMVKQIKGQYSVKSPDLKPLYEEAKRRIGRMDTFHMEHVLRGKNKEADRLANEAMDRGMGRAPQAAAPSIPAASQPSAAARSAAATEPAAATRPAATPRPAPRPAAPAVPPGELPAEVTGFVKNGVVHLVEGHLPEGTFVRILPARR